MNIYDLVGNRYEWILEKGVSIDVPNVVRGGNFDRAGSLRPRLALY